MPGYSLKLNGEYARIESLLCPYCGLVLKEAIQTEKGTRLCLSCYKEIQRNPKVLERRDDIELEPNEPYHPDKAVRREIDRLSVRCASCRFGCDWTGTLAEHEAYHKHLCRYNCPNRCGEQIEDLENHLSQHCPLRYVQCQYCNTAIKAGETDMHILSCPLAPFICDECGQVVVKAEKNNHVLFKCKSELICVGHIVKPPDYQQLVIASNLSWTKLTKEETCKPENEESQLKKKADVNKFLRHLATRVEKIENSSKQQEEVVKTLLDADWNAGGLEFHSSFDNGPMDSDYLQQLEGKVAEKGHQLETMKVVISELELQLQASIASTYNGSFLWRIPDIQRRRRDALEGKIISLYSPPFYTGRNGYKMCVRAYLNGDGIGYNTHLSIFFVLMKGDYDQLLEWPFNHEVSLILVSQGHKNDIVQTFKPLSSSSSFQQPKSVMNVASGYPQFADLGVLYDESYVKEDVMYIKCISASDSLFDDVE